MQLCWLNQIYIDLFVRGKEKQASISYSVLLGLVLCYFLLIHSLHQSSPPFCLTIGSTCFLSSWPEGQPQFLRGHTQCNRSKGHFGYHRKEELCTSTIRRKETLTTLYDRCQSLGLFLNYQPQVETLFTTETRERGKGRKLAGNKGLFCKVRPIFLSHSRCNLLESSEDKADTLFPNLGRNRKCVLSCIPFEQAFIQQITVDKVLVLQVLILSQEDGQLDCKLLPGTRR